MRFLLAAVLCFVTVIGECGPKSYSGGSSRSSSSSSFRSSTPSYKPSASSNPSYSPKPSTPSVKPSSVSTPSYKPNSTSTLSNAAKVQESKKAFDAAKNPPKPSYSSTAPTYTPKTPVSTASTASTAYTKPVEVKRYVTHERYVTYDNRASSFYRGYQPVHYHDSFSPFLMGYLFSSAINSSDRAYWAYHHRDQMDEARYREMLAKDSELNARVHALEKQGVARDPNYTLPQMKDNPDLQYKKDIVQPQTNWGNIGVYFLSVVLIVGLVYLCFFKEW